MKRKKLYLFLLVFVFFLGLSGCKKTEEAIRRYQELLKKLALPNPVLKEEEDLQILKTSVNPVRLKNNPVRLSEETLEGLYREILNEKN